MSDEIRQEPGGLYSTCLGLFHVEDLAQVLDPAVPWVWLLSASYPRDWIERELPPLFESGEHRVVEHLDLNIGLPTARFLTHLGRLKGCGQTRLLQARKRQPATLRIPWRDDPGLGKIFRDNQVTLEIRIPHDGEDTYFASPDRAVIERLVALGL